MVWQRLGRRSRTPQPVRSILTWPQQGRWLTRGAHMHNFLQRNLQRLLCTPRWKFTGRVHTVIGRVRLTRGTHLTNTYRSNTYRTTSEPIKHQPNRLQTVQTPTEQRPNRTNTNQIKSKPYKHQPNTTQTIKKTHVCVPYCPHRAPARHKCVPGPRKSQQMARKSTGAGTIFTPNQHLHTKMRAATRLAEPRTHKSSNFLNVGAQNTYTAPHFNMKVVRFVRCSTGNAATCAYYSSNKPHQIATCAICATYGDNHEQHRVECEQCK